MQKLASLPLLAQVLQPMRANDRMLLALVDKRRRLRKVHRRAKAHFFAAGHDLE